MIIMKLCIFNAKVIFVARVFLSIASTNTPVSPALPQNKSNT